MTKKTESATGRGDAAGAQSKMNELYTAHQVHTLAHLIFQHVANGWNGAQAWAAPGGGRVAPPLPGGAPTTGWTGGGVMAQPGAPQPLVYWYP